MYLIYARDTLSSDWHRIDADVKPIQRSSLCGHTPTVRSEHESPWCETWKNRMLAPPGKVCAKCDDIAKRLTRPLMPPTPDFDYVRGDFVSQKDVMASLGDDIAKLLEDL